MGRSRIASQSIGLALGLGVVWALGWCGATTRGQEGSDKGETTAKKKASVSTKTKAAAAQAAEDEKTVQIKPLVWAEPRRQALLRNTFPEMNGPVLTAAQQDLVLQMASGAASTDTALIKRYVDSNAAELTRKANIAALMGAEGSDAKKAHALDEAANRLIKPLMFPSTTNNQSFRRIYIAQLNSVAKNLLQGHLLTRTMFMVVLSRAGSTEVVPLIVAQIADPDQTYTVKNLGAVGLINISQRGRRPLDPNSQAIPAAAALADFLGSSDELPWPVQGRCLEALGLLRQSTADPAQHQAEFADVAFRILADSKAEPMVRAWAGWALSRMSFSGLPGAAPNLELIAHQLGDAAAAAGDQVASVPVPSRSPAKNLPLAARYAQPLVRILDAFVGEPELRGSGLDTMSAGGRELRGIEQRIRALTTASVQMTQSAGIQVAEARQAVAAATQELRAYLGANVPKSLELYRGGPKLELEQPADSPKNQEASSEAANDQSADAKQQP